MLLKGGKEGKLGNEAEARGVPVPLAPCCRSWGQINGDGKKSRLGFWGGGVGKAPHSPHGHPKGCRKGKGMVEGVPWRARSGFGVKDGASAEWGSFPARRAQLHSHGGAVSEGCERPKEQVGDLPRGPSRNPTAFLLRDDFFLSDTLLSLKKDLARTARSAQSSNARHHCTKTHRFSSLGRRQFGRERLRRTNFASPQPCCLLCPGHSPTPSALTRGALNPSGRALLFGFL